MQDKTIKTDAGARVFEDGLRIIGNNIPRQFLFGYELTDKELSDFDYLEEAEQSDNFIRYRGRVYHISDFMRIPETAPARLRLFDGIVNDSAFSGVLIKLSPDNETFRIFTYLS